MGVLGRVALVAGTCAAIYVLFHLWIDPSTLRLGSFAHADETREGFFACKDTGVCALIPFSFNVQRHIDLAFANQAAEAERVFSTNNKISTLAQMYIMPLCIVLYFHDDLLVFSRLVTSLLWPFALTQPPAPAPQTSFESLGFVLFTALSTDVLNINSVLVVYYYALYRLFFFLLRLAEASADAHISSASSGLARSHVLLTLYMCLLFALFGAVHAWSGLTFDELLPWTYLLLDISLACLHGLFRLVLHGHNLESEGYWANYSLFAVSIDATFQFSRGLLWFMHHWLVIFFRGGLHLSPVDVLLLLRMRGYLREWMLEALVKVGRYNRLARRFPEASALEIEDHDDMCAVCHNDMREACKLPCSHMFHRGCLQMWTLQQNCCPICRIQLDDLQASTAARKSGRLTDSRSSPLTHADGQ